MSNDRLELGSYEEHRNGVPLKFSISTIPQHLVEPVIEHLTSYYVDREPMSVYYKLSDDPEALELYRKIWRMMISEGTSLVALRDGPEEEAKRIIGGNITYIMTNEDKPKPEFIKGTKIEPLYDTDEDLADKSQIFEKYGVNKILGGFGLSVHPDYHGYKIGERLLACREQLCKKFGIKVTGTVFTHPASQYLSKKLGFEVIYEEEFSKYMCNGVKVFENIPGKIEMNAREYSN